jgi:ribosome biogenesis GTPase
MSTPSSSTAAAASSAAAHPLSRYGWDTSWADAFAALPEAGLTPARVVRAERLEIVATTGEATVRAALGPVGNPTAAPCTGDFVALFQASSDNTQRVVRVVLPRRTALVRSSAGRDSHGQVLAANVDSVAVVVALSEPPKYGRTERMLALAWESGAVPVIVLTKADMSADPIADQAAIRAIAPGVETVLTSAITGLGMGELAARLTGSVVLIGSSGAGKSTLGNALIGDELWDTGRIREADGKGRHTTAWRELVALPGGGVLIDTPGIRTIGLHDAADGIEQAFSDIEELAASCRFADCAHAAEPGCAVRAAIDSGHLAARRLDSYRKLLRENDYQEARSNARLRADRAAAWKAIHRQQRAAYRFRDRQGDGGGR